MNALEPLTPEQRQLKEAKVQLSTLAKVLEKKELSDRERKLVESTKGWLTRNFDVTDVLR